jgi:hypothetical protein
MDKLNGFRTPYIEKKNETSEERKVMFESKKRKKSPVEVS